MTIHAGPPLLAVATVAACLVAARDTAHAQRFDAGRAAMDAAVDVAMDAAPSHAVRPPAVGTALAPPNAARPDVPLAPVRMLGSRVLTSCDATAALSYFEARCAPLPVVAVRASGADASGAAAAADGSACTVWNAGAGAPQVLELTLAQPAVVHGLLLVPECTPNPARTEIVVELVSDAGVVRAWRNILGLLTSNVAYGYLLDAPPPTRRIRVRTIGSPSWVAWREVQPFACTPLPQAAPPAPPRPPADPRDYVVLPGRGPCTRDRDCRPDACCGARRCVDAAHAPRCESIACPASVAPFDDARAAGCRCVQGRCASRVHRRWAE